MAVWLVPIFLEGSFVELLQTERTHKVLRMKFSKHCSDATAGNGLSTPRTGSSAHFMVMVLAIGETFVLEKVAVREGLATLPEKD